MNIENKTFLVAGAAGMIPSHVCEYYLERGAKVFGVDNFISGSEANIKDLLKNKNFSFEKADVSKSVPTFNGQSFDYVLSLASPASPKDFSEIPLEIMAVNSEGTKNLLEVAKLQGARFLEASTSEVYGDPEVHPQKESYFGSVNPIGPRACYDESKRFAEALTMSYHRKFSVDTRIVRIFNTYGPRMRINDGRVIPNFISQAMKGEDLTVYGDGNQTRSFCFVSDLVEAMNIVLMSNEHQPVNIGNPDEYTIRQCAEIVIEVLNSSSKIVSKPLPVDDPKRRRPDIQRLRSLGDFTPKVDFKTGLKRTAEYFKTTCH